MYDKNESVFTSARIMSRFLFKMNATKKKEKLEFFHIKSVKLKGSTDLYPEQK